MRGQSYSNKKNNSNKEDFQGGETKVMKKSLKMLLVFALVFSMFAPAIGFAAEAEMDAQAKFDAMVEAGILEGIDGEAALDKNMQRNEVAKILANIFELEVVANAATPFPDEPADNWGYTDGYIQAVVATGLMIGGEKPDGTTGFQPSKQLTTQELAVVLARALGLELDADAEVEGKTSVWATAHVAAVVAAELLPASADYTVDATRGDLVSSTYVVYVQVEAAKEEEAKAGLATGVKSVTASNLLQVVVNFDGLVDKSTASDKDNYSLSNDRTVASASVSEDSNSVTLTLDRGTKMTNQQEYKMTFNNVRAGDTILSTKDYKFTPVDSTLPVVEKVEALGNSTVRVSFSEPIMTANTSSFMVDDKPLIGNVSIVGNNTAIVKVYSPLSNGEHSLTVSGAVDFATFKSLSKTFDFTVVEDTVAPTIVSVENATFEYVTIKFSEPVDPATVLGSNVYWLQGTTKHYADAVATVISDDTFRFNFSDTRKLQYATDLDVSGVKDYSGNTIVANSKIQVTPVIDQTRPEVVNAELDSANKVFSIKFNKNLFADSANRAANYVVKDKDGKVVSQLKTPLLQPDNKTVKVTLATALSSATNYTLEVSGVSDNTVLKNVMLPYSKEFNIGDTSGPNSADVTVNSNTTNNSIIVNYPKQMAVSGDGSIVEASKYLYNNGTSWRNLPLGTLLNITPDGKSAILTFPSDVSVTTVAELRVQLVKDTAGNYLTGLTEDYVVTAAAQANLTSVAATASNKISVNFDAAILGNTVNAADFTVQTVGGVTRLNVVAAEVHSSVSTRVVLTLAEATKLNANATYNVAGIPTDVEVLVRSSATTSTPAGQPIAAVAASTLTAKASDSIKSAITAVEGSANGSSITVKFNENLATVANDTYSAATDLVVELSNGAIVNPGTGVNEYTVSTTANELTINFGSAKSGVMTVAIPNPRFIKDIANNIVATSDAIQVLVDNASPTASVGGTNNVTTLALTFNEAVASAVIVSQTTTETATMNHVLNATTASITVANGGASNTETVTFRITDLAGHTATYKATWNTGAWTLVLQ